MTANPETALKNRISGPAPRIWKACIAIPPVFDFYFSPRRFSGLGPEIVSDCLAIAGCSVQILNFPLQRKKGATIPLPAALRFLTPHLMAHEEGKLAFFTRYQRFGPLIPECADQIVKMSPDLLFIACFAFCYGSAALALAARIHAVNPEVTIVMGGAGVSAYPEFFIENSHVNFVLTGEAEVSLKPFFQAFRSETHDFSQVPNLYQKTGGPIRTPVNKKQTSAREIAFVFKKTGETRTAVYFTTSLSRGCQKRCRFCSNFLCHGRDFRVIPADTIKRALTDMALPLETGKTVIINFEDDNLLLAPNYFLEVMDIFRNRFSGVTGVSFLAENGVDHTRLTPELAKSLILKGMRQFNLSIASTHTQILAEEQRHTEFVMYENALKTIHQHGIPCITYFICGFKKDTPETVVANILYLANLPTLIGISLFYPVPGIPDYTDASLFDKVPPCLCAGSSAFPWNGSLTTGQMVTAFRLARLVNLLKSGRQTSMDKALIDRTLRHRRLYTVEKVNKSKNIIPVPGTDEKMVQVFFDGLHRNSLTALMSSAHISDEA